LRNTIKVYFFLCLLIGLNSYAQTPVANFSSSVTSGCSPLPVNFKDLSTGNPTSWEWDLGNGTISTKKDPSGFYNSPGTYQVRLTVTNASGRNTRTGTIIVYENPKPAFIADKRDGCAPLTVTFTDQSDPGAGSNNVSWLWDLGNGVQSTERNPSVKYNASGTYPVVLKVINDKGCSNILTQNRYITVTPGLELDFAFTPADVCKPPFQIQFKNNSRGDAGLKYTWKFGDGKTSTEQHPSHKYESNGKFTVTLIATNGSCTDSVIKEIDLSEIKTDFSISGSACVNNAISLKNISSPLPASSIWKFSDGTTVSQVDAIKVFNTPGDHTVQLINSYGSCKDSTKKTITISKSPTANFKPSLLSNCSPGISIDFDNLSTDAVRYEWDFGDGSPIVQTTNTFAISHTYSSVGEYYVTLLAFNAEGCSQRFTYNQPIVIARPKVNLQNIPEEGCAPLTINPVASVSALSGIKTYEWDFGDGTVINGSSPTHVFTKAGNYTIKLTITTNDGCTSSSSQQVAVGNKPMLSFIAAPRNVCAIDSVYFTNNSQPADAKYTWIFGDGGMSDSYNAIYSYNDTGWFQVKLVVNNNGCIDTLSSEKEFIYIKAPIARFSIKPNCTIAYQYQFVDQSLFDKGSEARRTWKWEFPDGTVSNSQVPPVYNFPGPGTYPITLTISNGNCVHKTTRLIEIEDKKPDFTFNKDQNCAPVSYTFKAITPRTQQVVSYKWEIGGFDTVTLVPELTRFFTVAGNYELKLTTTDIFGCVNSVTKPVEISGVKAAFERTNLEDCKKMTATFTDKSESFGGGKIVSWKWDFGDGTQVDKNDNKPIDHVYAKPGDYKVQLSVKDASGCTDQYTLDNPVTILEMKPDYVVSDKACLGFPISYQNSSSGQYVSFAWDFGDGSAPVSQHSGTHTYKDTGYYDIKLVLQDVMGCKDSLVRKQYVHIAQPVAAFTVKDSISYCPPFDVNFTNTSKFFGRASWKIGDERSMEVDHRKLFTIPGTYKVDLQVVSPDGRCKSSTSKTITLYKPEDATFEYDPLQACLPGIVNLKAFDKLSSARFFWDFGDGNILDTAANEVRHVYTDLGSFTPKIILTEATGCMLTIEGKVPVHIKGVKTRFDVTSKFFCDSGIVNIKDTTTSNDRIVKYFWDFGDGTTSDLKLPVHKYSTPGVYSIFHSVETESGCIDSMRLNAPVRVVAAPVIDIKGDSIICVNEYIKHTGILINRDTSAIKWSWQFPNGNSSIMQSPAIQQYQTPGKFQIKTIAVNSSGCADTMIQNIVVHPNPVVTLPSVITTIVGKPVTLPGKYSTNIYSYAWSPDKFLSCNNCPQPVASPRFDTKYVVSVVDSNGCKNSGEVFVKVLCEGVTVFLPNTFSPNGDGVNDIFYVRGQGLDRVKMLRIFNRWGELVFERKDFPANNSQYGWDGKFKGNKPVADVYVYQVEVYCDNGSLMVFPGNVALIQ